MGNVLTTLAKIDSIRIKAAATTIDAAIQKQSFGSGITTLIISNEEMEYIMKIVKSESEESSLLMKGVRETIKNQEKEQKDVFLPMLLGTLATSLLKSAFAGRR